MVKISEFREAFSFSKKITINYNFITINFLASSLPLHPKYPFAKGKCIPTTQTQANSSPPTLYQSLRPWLFHPISVEWV